MFSAKPHRQRKSGSGRIILTLLLLWAFCLNHENRLPKTLSEQNNRENETEQVAAPGQSAGDLAVNSTDTDPTESDPPLRKQGHFTLLSQQPGEWRFRFDLGEYEIQEVEREDGRFAVIHSASAWFLQNRGKPELPVFRTDFAVPTDADCRLEIISVEQEQIACLPPLPSGGLTFRSQPPGISVPPERAVYQGQQPYPLELATVNERYQLREVSGVGLRVTPMQYLPQESELLVSRSFEAVLRVIEPEENSVAALPQLDDNASFAVLQQENFLNGTQLTRSGASSIGTLLLILPDAWQSAVADFVLWKRRIGYQVEVARYPADTGEGSANIAIYIAKYYQEHALTHLILCGDWNDLPPWRKTLRLDGTAPTASPNALITTDAPYALLSTSDPGSPDYAADIMLSRVSVDSAAELASVLSKLQQHERGQGGSVWRSKGLFLASKDSQSQDFGWDNDFIAEDNGKILMDHVYVERCRQLLLTQGEYTASSTLYEGISPMLSASLVSSSLNAGVSLFYYLGHGNVDSFTTSGFNVAAANSLSNGNALSFVVSPVCHTGNFAVAAGDCLSEALLNNLNGGAAAILSCTGESFWKAPIVLFWKFTDSLLSERPRLPDTGTIALNSIIEGIRYCQTTNDDEGGSQKYFFELMHLLGDSSQVLRLAGERALQVEYEWTVAGLQVQLFWPGESGNIPVPGAKVCLELGTLGEYVSGCSDDLGQVLLPVEQIYLSYTLRVLDASAPMQEISLLNLDCDNNGVISNPEMLTWLSEWDAIAEKPAQILASALAQWQASGSAETRQTVQQPESVVPVYLPSELQLQIACPNPQELKRLHDAGVDLLNFQNGIAYLEGRQELADRLVAAGFDIVSVSVIERSETRSVAGYPSFAELQDELFDIAAHYANFCRLSLLGKSVQGREILALRVSLAEEGAEVPELLIAGGIHGDEPPSIEMVRRLLKYLCEQVDLGDEGAEDVQNILQNCVLWLIPVMNPDGLELGQRENANYADLNRNFPDGVVLEPKNLGTFAAGDSLRLAGLQPEQLVIMRWLAARRITAALHLHTGSLKVCYPYGNFKTNLAEAKSPDDAIFKALAFQYADLNDDMSASDVINAAAWYLVTGELADWQYRFLGTLPWTVELVGSSKAPPYDTMDELWNANRPALLAWMEQIKDRYPIGLPVPTRSNDSTWWAQFQFEQPQYLPGYQNPMQVQFGDFSSNVPTALILVSKTPLDWVISAGSSGLQPLASRPEEDNQTAWLFYPGESGWSEGLANFTLLPPEDTSNEAIFAAELFWDGGQWDCYPKHWLPLPEREIDFAWTAGWNAFALPMIPKASRKLPFAAFWEWRDNQFHNISEITSGQAYFAYADSAETTVLSGWMREETSLPPQNGWNLKGVFWKRRAAAQEQILSLDNVHKVPQIQQELLPGVAFWLFQ